MRDRPQDPPRDQLAADAVHTVPLGSKTEEAAGFETSRDRFETFYRENHSATMRFARSRSTDSEAEAIVADSFLVAWEHFLNGHELSRVWLYGIVRNKLGDLYRSSRRTRETVSDQLPETSTIDTTATSALKITVQRAISLLSADYSEILALAYWSDLPPPDAAKVLGISHVNYRVRLLRAQRALAKARRQPEEGTRVKR